MFVKFSCSNGSRKKVFQLSIKLCNKNPWIMLFNCSRVAQYEAQQNSLTCFCFSVLSHFFLHLLVLIQKRACLVKITQSVAVTMSILSSNLCSLQEDIIMTFFLNSRAGAFRQKIMQFCVVWFINTLQSFGNIQFRDWWMSLTKTLMGGGDWYFWFQNWSTSIARPHLKQGAFNFPTT